MTGSLRAQQLLLMSNRVVYNDMNVTLCIGYQFGGLIKVTRMLCDFFQCYNRGV